MEEVYEEMRFYACDEKEAGILKDHQQRVLVDQENSHYTVIFSRSDVLEWTLKNRDLMQSISVHHEGKALQISGYTNGIEVKDETIEVSCRIANIVEEYIYHGNRVERPSSHSRENRREVPNPHRTPQRNPPRKRDPFARPSNGK